MYNEQTFVVKDKTFSDTAVKELADTKARLVMIPISSDALNIAKAREILIKHEM